MEKFGCLGLLVILLGLLVVWGTILNIPNAGEWPCIRTISVSGESGNRRKSAYESTKGVHDSSCRRPRKKETRRAQIRKGSQKREEGHRSAKVCRFARGDQQGIRALHLSAGAAAAAAAAAAKYL